MSDESRTTGMGLWTDANQMLRAAKHLMNVKEMSLSPPLYFLLGHALELTFKAYIRAKGASLSSIKAIGHDLVVAKEWAVTASIEQHASLTEEEHKSISLLNEYYRKKEFEYRVSGAKKYPEPALVAALIEKLLKGTKNECFESVKIAT
jgi:hypothetical protein